MCFEQYLRDILGMDDEFAIPGAFEMYRAYCAEQTLKSVAANGERLSIPMGDMLRRG